MKLLSHELVIAVIGLIVINKAEDPFMVVPPALLDRSSQACLEVSKEPYFNSDLVIGKPWRLYYTWKMKLGEACVDAHCQPATPQVIERIHYDMNRSLSEQPEWELASLLMTVGKNRQQMLLFPDLKIPGRFLGVNYFISDTINRPTPLLKLQMKLLREGKYLLFLDCQVGIGFLASRLDEESYRMDIATAVSLMTPYLGDGHEACTEEKNFIEDAVTPEIETQRPNIIL